MSTGIPTKYNVGKTYTKFDTGMSIANHELVGVTADTFERGQWKRTSDGMVTPSMIRKYLLNCAPKAVNCCPFHLHGNNINYPCGGEY